MAYYLVKYDCGYGSMAEVVDADDQKQAEQIAYDMWREAAESAAEYSAELATFDNVSGESHENPADYGLTPPPTKG